MNELRKLFQEIYSKKPLLVASPGRVNLIGEHTDYNEGFVLPGAVDKKMFVAIASNETNSVNVFAKEYNEHFSFRIDEIKAEKKETWTSYLIGVVYLLQQKGCAVKGVDVIIDGNVPVGAGMSSSAALSCAFSFALNELFQFGLKRIDLAYIGQKTEHIFVGAMVGIMDPFASLHGKAGHLIKLDCRSMEFEYIHFDFPDHKIVMVNSMVKHSLAGSEYNVRRKQCEEGVETMKRFIQGSVKSLRDVPLKALEDHRNELDETVYKRCLYVITENERLFKGCELLEKNDVAGFGELMYQTHQGLSKLYEVSCEELDLLAEQAHAFDGVTGTRMMGGGFGGCTINLVRQDKVEEFSTYIKSKYSERFNKDPEIYITQIEDGTKVIE